MFSLAVLALAGIASTVEALPIPHTVRLFRRAEVARRGKITYQTKHHAPHDWALSHNEPYDLYHFRYITVGCAQMHDTAFFDECCHPRIYYQTDNDFEYECSLGAHMTGSNTKKINNQIDAANVEASHARHLHIVSSSSVSVASVQSSHSVISASKASKVSVASASSASIHSKHVASRSSIASKASAKASKSSASVESSKEAKSSKEHPSTSAHSSHSKPTPTSTSEKSSAKPKPTEKPKPSPSSHSPPPAPTTTDSGSSGSSGGGSGGSSGGKMYGAQYGTPSFGTWYKQAGTIGACGLQSSPISDYSKVVAQRYDFYDGGSACGKNVKVCNTANGACVVAMVNDECMGCQTPTSLDMSLGAFQEIADFVTGEIAIDWEYV